MAEKRKREKQRIYRRKSHLNRTLTQNPIKSPKNREYTKNIKCYKSKNNRQKIQLTDLKPEAPTDPTTDKTLTVKHTKRRTANPQPAKKQ